MNTTIIAEAGVNHNGNLTIAKEMIQIAANSGADYIKFQTFKAENIVTLESKVARYQTNLKSGDSQYLLLKRLELSDSDFYQLKKICNNSKIKFMSTAFDIESANLLFEIGQNIFKIPSGEITNLPYLRHVGAFNKEIILSTGASNFSEINRALEILTKAGTKLENITVLHCTSAYPADLSEVNLKAMVNIAQEFSVKVGYSDHTMGVQVALAAVALGATVIEKHFTLNRNMEGPDHKASLEPNELIDLVKGIRNIELALGNGIKIPSPGELENIDIIRKSIVARVKIKKGEKFSSLNLTCKRPASGISPMKWDEVIGQVAKRDFETDELVQID